MACLACFFSFLRRLKKEVAPELPPRTEVVLYTELSQGERDLYDALLASTRKDVVSKLEKGQNVIEALELLLRLRQACCHGSLVPGQTMQHSSKLSLLDEKLKDLVDGGHKALVFSQWTSLLDLIEPTLKESEISYLRLDGSSRNRSEIVNEFQKDDE